MSTLTDHSRTNNLSDGWHNRFRLVVGRDHPDIYSIIKDFWKEQDGTEKQITELLIARRAKAARKNSWIDAQKMMKKIAEMYVHYEVQRYREYLDRIAMNIVIS